MLLHGKYMLIYKMSLNEGWTITQKQILFKSSRYIKKNSLKCF